MTGGRNLSSMYSGGKSVGHSGQDGTKELCFAIMDYLQDKKEQDDDTANSGANDAGVHTGTYDPVSGKIV